MALKDLLVYVDPTEDARIRCRLAADLAVRHQSHLTALYVKEWSHAQLAARKAAELGLVSHDRLHDLDSGIEASIDAGAERLKSLLEECTRGRGAEVELLPVDGVAAVVVPQRARYADLCILSPDEPEGPASIDYTFAEHLLFVTGRPVLFVPAIPSLQTLGQHVAIAWNSSRPATRSVNDALPLIERAEKTTVLMVNSEDFIERHGAPPGEELVQHLQRHGAVAEAVRIGSVPAGAIADTLQNEARSLGADLIVAGAFGHPRLWEKLLGGVTRDLLARMTLPIFMSH